ncbi:MAG: Holliday junction branch migration protein RuvA [Coriobacteriaceae bacterium]|nr:Holliday junction branch migration protein RuvA [Coriobacteriaceae bacterium]
MISQVYGSVLEAFPTSVVIDVNGIGFELGISASTAAALPPVGESARLYTRMVVREDSCTLFGFATRDERTMFDRLVAVSGVGAKLALAVLSTYSAQQLYAVVMAQDDKAMSKVSGVGKKTAQRLILELKSVFEKDRSLAGASVSFAEAPLPLAVGAAQASTALDDAMEALLSMGFTSQEASLALDGFDGSNMRVEELLGAALKRLGMDA